MDEALKKRIRSAWTVRQTACDHCGREAKALANDVFKESVQAAIAYVNSLGLPPEYGELRFHEQFFPHDVAYWTKGFAKGVLHGDDMDGGEEAWYWSVPTDETIRWKSTPGSTLIALVEHLEEKYGKRVVTEPEPVPMPPSPPREAWKWWLGDASHWVAYPDKVLRVGEITDEHLRNILAYLAKWTPRYVSGMSTLWMIRNGYFSHAINDLGEAAQDAVAAEAEALAEQTDREWMERIIPALKNLEAEARRRGFDVPAIPSYPDPKVESRQEATAP